MTRIPFILLSTTDGSPITGATPTVTISKDGGAFTSATNAPAEIGNGYYYVDLTMAETTVTNNVIVRATATGAQPTAVVWEPEPIIPTAADNATAVWGAQDKIVTIDSSQAATIATAAALATVGDNVTAIKAKTDTIPQNPAAVGDAMTLTSDYNAAKTASQFDPSTDTVTIAGASVTAIQTGLSTFDPSVSTVTINSTQAGTFGTATAQTSILALLETLYSGLYHWEVNNNTLTIYDADGLAVSTYTLTKDAIGNIIAVTPEE